MIFKISLILEKNIANTKTVSDVLILITNGSHIETFKCVRKDLRSFTDDNYVIYELKELIISLFRVK